MKKYIIVTMLSLLSVIIYSHDIGLQKPFYALDEKASIILEGKYIANLKIVSAKDITALYNPPSYAQIIMIEYIYENIDINSFEVGKSNFQVVDEDSFVAFSADYGPPITKLPQEIIKGLRASAQAVFGLVKKSKNIKILYRYKKFDERTIPLLIFDVPVQ